MKRYIKPTTQTYVLLQTQMICESGGPSANFMSNPGIGASRRNTSYEEEEEEEAYYYFNAEKDGGTFGF